MRNGEIREQGPAKQRVRARRRTPTRKALLQCRPQLDAASGRACRSSTTSWTARAHADERAERPRGVTGAEPIVLDVQHLGKSFYSREGLLRPARVQGGEGRVVRAAQGQDARARRRIRLGQDDGRR